MLGQEEVLTAKLVTFYKEFEFEFSQYEYDNDVYYPILTGMAEDQADELDVPAELLIDFVKRMH